MADKDPSSYSKKKATNPMVSFRTPSAFKAQQVGGAKPVVPGVKFNQSTFKTQHKG